MFQMTKGYTIVEVVVTVAILGSLYSISSQSLPYFFARTHAESDLIQIRKLLDFARGYALKNKVSTTLCPLQNHGTQCISSWDKATLTLFLDMNQNGKKEGNEPILSTLEVGAPYHSVHYPRKHITYLPNGRLKGFLNGTVEICVHLWLWERSYRLIIPNWGRIRQAQTPHCRQKLR